MALEQFSDLPGSRQRLIGAIFEALDAIDQAGSDLDARTYGASEARFTDAFLRERTVDELADLLLALLKFADVVGAETSGASETESPTRAIDLAYPAPHCMGFRAVLEVPLYRAHTTSTFSGDDISVRSG